MIHGLQSPLNFIGVGALLPEKFNHLFMFNVVQIDIMDIRSPVKRPMRAFPQ
jgi:hypothetical protein